MADGVEKLNVVLSIGFLNKKIEENLALYKVFQSIYTFYDRAKICLKFTLDL